MADLDPDPPDETPAEIEALAISALEMELGSLRKTSVFEGRRRPRRWPWLATALVLGVAGYAGWFYWPTLMSLLDR